MIFRQLFDYTSYTYTYLLSSGIGREAILIDPVFDNLNTYLNLINELQLQLVVAIDTHMHADHITATGPLQQQTQCAIAMGSATEAECVTTLLREGETIDVDGISLQAIYTPGHTSDSYSFQHNTTLFTGDTLLIRGTGRTDFQNGNTSHQYDSIFNKLLQFPDDTLVYPAHDYNGMTVSTIGEEKRCNPRLQVHSVDEYIEIMSNLKLDNPQFMDVAIAENRYCGSRYHPQLTS